MPQTLAEHLKRRRRELGLFQRQVADRMGIAKETYTNWEKGKTEPVASQFKPVIEFLGYDPTPAPTNLAERLQAKRRALGTTFSQVARYLDWDEGTLTRYLKGIWRIPRDRIAELEAFLAAEEAELSDLRLLPRRWRHP